MELESIVSMGSMAVGLFSSVSSARASRKVATFYDEQAEMNRQIGAFNAEVSEFNGRKAVAAIAKQTKQLLADQTGVFHMRGISLDGSPQMVLGQTLAMGSEKAQEAAFNANVQAVNYRYSAMSAVAEANAKSEEARYAAKTSLLKGVGQLLQGNDLKKSAETLGIDPTKNIFDVIGR